MQSYSKQSGVYSVRCNRTRSAFTIATERGVKVFCIDPLALRVNLKCRDVGSCTVAELYYESNVIALVGGGNKQKFDEKSVILMDIESGQVLFDLTFHSCVLAIRFTQNKLVVVLQDQIHIFEMNTFRKLQTIETGYNPASPGLCEVSFSGVMVFPASSKGHVHVLDTNQLRDGTTVSPGVINAHRGRIVCVAISNDGKTIATASQKGTLVRIFNVATKKKELEVRRGCDTAVVYSISFSPCDGFLSVCSDKGTVHVFAVKDSSLNSFGLLGPVALYLPKDIGKPLESKKSLAQFSVPAECPCALVYLDNQMIVAISMDGTFQKHVVTPQGFCKQKLSAFTLDMGDDFYD